VVEASRCLRIGRKLRVARSLVRNAGVAPLRVDGRTRGGKLELYRPNAAQAF
jgi:hypothetical protein